MLNSLLDADNIVVVKNDSNQKHSEHLLLVNLSKLACRRTEDFVTDSFVHLLRHLAQRHPEFTNTLLRDITGSKLDFDMHPDLIQVRSYRGDEDRRSYPDIELRDDRHHIIIEVKVDADIDQSQLEKYAVLAKEYSLNKDARVAMIIGAKKNSNADAGIKINRWYEVALRLENKNFRGSEVTNYLVNQFLYLLRWNDVYSYPAIGDLSKELSHYMEAMSKGAVEREHSILFKINRNKKFQSVAGEFDDLPVLLNTLTALHTTIERVFSTDKIRFATFEKKMIGLTFEGLVYGCWIEYADPDKLWLQYYNDNDGVPLLVANRTKLNSGDEFSMHNGKPRFDRYLDLNSAGYFKMNDADKVQYLNREITDFRAFCEDKFRSPQ